MLGDVFGPCYLHAGARALGASGLNPHLDGRVVERWHAETSALLIRLAGHGKKRSKKRPQPSIRFGGSSSSKPEKHTEHIMEVCPEIATFLKRRVDFLMLIIFFRLRKMIGTQPKMQTHPLGLPYNITENSYDLIVYSRLCQN